MEMHWVLCVKHLDERFVALEGKSGQYLVPRDTAYVPSYLRVGDTVRLESAVHFGRARLSLQVIPNEVSEPAEDAGEPPSGPVQFLVVYEHCAPIIG
jgi:hypothetical protein